MKTANRINIRWSKLPRDKGFIGVFLVSDKMLKVLDCPVFVIDSWYKTPVEKLDTPKHIRSVIDKSSIRLFGHRHFNF